MWPVVTLDDIFTIARGGSPRPIDAFITDDDSGVNWIMIGDANEGSKYIESTKKKIRPEGVSRSRMVYPGDFLLTNSMSFGKPYILKTSGCIHDGWLVLSPKSDQIYPDYFYYLLGSPLIYSEFKRLAAGAVVKNLNIELAKSLKLRLPPLDDQKRIAHLLGKVEGLIAQRKQHLQQLDALLKSVFLEMFGPRNAAYHDWPEVEIRSLAADHKGAMRTGPFGSNLLHSEFSENGDVAVLGIDNAVQNRFSWGEPRFITSEKYKELESYRIFPSDVIVTIMGTIGRSAVIPKDIPLAINTKHLAAITLDHKKANPMFLAYSIHSSPYILNQFKSKNRGAIMSGLNLGLIKETKLRRPPIDIQNRFAEIHQRVDAIKERIQQSLTDLEALYGALSQKAFAGELDLSRVLIPLIDEVTPPPMGLTKFQEEPTSGFVVPKIPKGTNLGDRAQREAMIGQWLEAYLKQLPSGQELSTAIFVDAVNTAFQSEDDIPAWGLTDQDKLKNWIFNQLDTKRIIQTRNMIEIDGSPELGNRIVLMKAT